MTTVTVFERIPDLFVQLYDFQFQTWAREFRKRGPKCAIVFQPLPGQVPLFDANGNKIMKGAWFTAEVDRSVPVEIKVIIRPATDHDAEMVARHVREMTPHVLH